MNIELLYLSNLKLWNFRKFGTPGTFDLDKPNLDLDFGDGVNVLIGENDSGKSAIIDAIKLVLKTHASEWIKVDYDDFHQSSQRLRIECMFSDLADIEAKNFIEWLGHTGEGDKMKPFLRVLLDVKRRDEMILPTDIRAGVEADGHLLTVEAKEYLKTTYLKPLRDAKNELVPRRNSRLSQILSGHQAFKGQEKSHRFVGLVGELNAQIEGYFKGTDKDGKTLGDDDKKGQLLKEVIDKYLTLFSDRSSKFEMSGGTLKSILEGLSLLFMDEMNLGLGSHNLLFIASELLHLQRADWSGLKLGLVEEIEAHLHPQIQLQVIETLQNEAKGIQLILTTHSPNIGSKTKLKNLIICTNNNAFPMGPDYTKLSGPDYKFLERFLDVTKANLFFAKGVILVEGWAEELILPVIAEKMGVNLTKAGVSIVNIANTAFLRYSQIFERLDGKVMDLPVAVVTDVDVKPFEAGVTKTIAGTDGKQEEVQLTRDEIEALIISSQEAKTEKYEGDNVEPCISPYWTLEYCIARSLKLRKVFYKSVLEALIEQKEDDGVLALEKYQLAVTNVDKCFSNWTQNEEEIAYKIYDHVLNGNNDLGLAKDKISKSIIGQRFADNLKNEAVDKIQDEPSIDYLINAITYAS
ncbi:ATP-dependent nuclease [Pedobacter suwonensis]|uniref:ATP-dependent nuclease n=1 Tax=Pedobacter suwonensis TaxID=332999 RepID=UPI001C95A75E|nr:AAA family ATPase [Pedobacter suwonensis]